MSLKQPTTYNRMSFSLALGLLGAFGMGPFYIWPLLLISLSLFWVTFTGFADDKPWKSFLSGFVYGFGFYCGSLWWIGNALLVGGNPFKWAYPLAVCGLPALLALFTMMAVGLTRLCAKGRSLKSYAAFLGLFFVAEWARGHFFTGFPWNLTGMTWSANLPVMQILSVGGIYSLTALSIFMLSVAGFAWKGAAPKFLRYSLSIFALFIYLSLNIFGFDRLNKNPTSYHQDVVVQLIQPNIAQEDKWDGRKVWDNYRSLLNILKPDEMATYTSPIKTRLIVLPETALTYHELGTPQAREALLGKLSGYSEPNVFLLSGTLLHDDIGYHNALVALDQHGNLLKTFDKFHLVPFGEYMPFQKYIPFGPIVNFEGFHEGDGPHTISLPDAPSFSPLVCYEVIFAGQVVAKDEQRPEWILNVTNDAWYGISPGPMQHLAQAQYRAIEEGLPVVRVANTGVSAIFDAYGRMVLQTGLFSESAAEHFLPQATPEPTIYAKFTQ